MDNNLADAEEHKVDLLENGVKHKNNLPMKSPNLGSASVQQLKKDYLKLRKYFIYFFLASVSGFFLLIAILIGFYVSLNIQLGSHEHAPKVSEQIHNILENQQLCVPCASVLLGPSQEEDIMLNTFRRRKEADGEQCCVETPPQLLSLLQLFVERRFREEMAKGNINLPGTTDSSNSPRKHAAHLMGSTQKINRPTVPGRQFSIDNWIHNADLGFTSQVTYRHGRIVVKASGLYYVYSQISFLEVFDVDNRGVATRNDYMESHSLSHYMYRYNLIYPNGGEEELMQNSITKCWGQNKAFGEYSSYLGAVFYLRKGDEVFVKVSNLTLIVQNPKSNYFGLFKL